MRISHFGCTSLLVLISNACGGAAPPPDSAESASADAPSSAAASSDAATDEGQAAGSAAEKSASSAPASDDDVSAILQLVVDDPELDAHLHLGEPGRFPLKVAGDKLPSGLKLVKATEPVQVSEPPKSKKDAVLVFTEIDIQGSKATVRYRYDIEGIRATVTLAKTPHGWELKNSRLVEH
jgi:hypothetical protein